MARRNPPRGSGRGTGASRSVHVLRVEVAGIEPPVWREILLASEATLARLHDVIQAAFGWTDSHLHTFYVGRSTLVDPAIEPDPVKADESRFTLADVLPRSGAAIRYEYDPGDCWIHEIVAREIRPVASGARLPAVRCVGGARACPPDDCGGTDGYADLVSALRSPNHVRHDELSKWLTWYRAEIEAYDSRFRGPFDPEAFDLAVTNAEIAEALQRTR